MITRRNFTLLGFAAAGLPIHCVVGASHVEFWNQKQPAEWSSAEIQELVTHSPWAKEGIVDMFMAGGRSGRRSRGARDQNNSTDVLPQVKALVRWETAAPIREAAKNDIATNAGGNYVISVVGLPMGEGRGESETLQERLKGATLLERRGKESLAPVQIQSRDTPQGAMLLFFFPKETRPIQVADKEVVFVTKLGPLELKVRFPLKEMIYKGRLEL